MKSDTNLSVGGFQFYTRTDADAARLEEQKIEYMEARMDYSSPESIKYIYEKAIQERMFKTPVGLRYMKQLQDFLLAQPDIKPDSIPEIPLYMNYGGEVRERFNPTRARVQARKRREKEKARFTISVLINIILVIAICAMFGISLSSDQPNIVNFERAILNKYAAWEQELTEREQVIRDKEKELKLNQ